MIEDMNLEQLTLEEDHPHEGTLVMRIITDTLRENIQGRQDEMTGMRKDLGMVVGGLERKIS